MLSLNSSYLFVDGIIQSSTCGGTAPRHRGYMAFQYYMVFIFRTPHNRAIRLPSAFFYGNYISPSLATRLYEHCNIHFTSLVGVKMRKYCIEWQRRICTPHLSQYYDVQLRRYLWINGSSLNQREVVQPEVTVMDFGFERCFPERGSEIRNKLMLLRWQ